MVVGGLQLAAAIGTTAMWGVQGYWISFGISFGDLIWMVYIFCLSIAIVKNRIALKKGQ